MALDHLTALQTNLLKSLLDLVAAVVWACWERAKEWRDECQARANEQQWPVGFRRLRVTPVKRRPVIRDRPRRVVQLNAGVVAVLVSRPEMDERVRRALGGCADLCFTRRRGESCNGL